MPTRFQLLKKFARRGSDETYTRKVRDMIIDGTPTFEAWFANVNKELTPKRAGSKIKVNAETIEAGLVDFKALAAETRRKMGASFEEGRRLGRSRAASGKDSGKLKRTVKK